MLIIALVPTGSNTWLFLVVGYDDYHAVPAPGGSVVPAACMWNRKKWQYWRSNPAFTYFLLVSNFTTRAGALFGSHCHLLKRVFPTGPLHLLREILHLLSLRLHGTPHQRGMHNRLYRFYYHTVLAVYCTILGFRDLYSSFFGRLFWNLPNLIRGTLQIRIARRACPAQVRREEDSWSFGQCISLFLLALPLAAAFESYHD